MSLARSIILTLVLLLQALVFITAGAAAKRNAIRSSEEALQVTLASLNDPALNDQAPTQTPHRPRACRACRRYRA